jgi:hypothetical protein
MRTIPVSLWNIRYLYSIKVAVNFTYLMSLLVIIYLYLPQYYIYCKEDDEVDFRNIVTTLA